MNSTRFASVTPLFALKEEGGFSSLCKYVLLRFPSVHEKYFIHKMFENKFTMLNRDTPYFSSKILSIKLK